MKGVVVVVVVAVVAVVVVVEEEEENAYTLLVGKSERKRPLGRPNVRWVDNIKMELGKMWTGLVWLRTGTSGGLLSMR
jgi:hypothetical protein